MGLFDVPVKENAAKKEIKRINIPQEFQVPGTCFRVPAKTEGQGSRSPVLVKDFVMGASVNSNDRPTLIWQDPDSGRIFNFSFDDEALQGVLYRIGTPEMLRSVADEIESANAG